MFKKLKDKRVSSIDFSSFICRNCSILCLLFFFFLSKIEAHKANQKDAEEEANSQIEDPKLAAKRLRQVAEAKELQAKQQAEKEGLDYDRIKSWDTSIAEAQKDQREKEWKEKNTDVGFSSKFF